MDIGEELRYPVLSAILFSVFAMNENGAYHYSGIRERSAARVQSRKLPVSVVIHVALHLLAAASTTRTGLRHI